MTPVNFILNYSKVVTRLIEPSGFGFTSFPEGYSLSPIAKPPLFKEVIMRCNNCGFCHDKITHCNHHRNTNRFYYDKYNKFFDVYDELDYEGCSE